MEPISTYANQNDKLRLALQGPAGSGKTTMACQFPRPAVVDVDINLGGTLRYLKQHNLQLPVSYAVLDRVRYSWFKAQSWNPTPIIPGLGASIDPDTFIDIPPKMRYLILDKILIEMQSSSEIDTIILDSGTTLADVLIAEVCRQQNKNAISDWKDGRQFWGFFAPLCRNFLGVLSQMRKHVVLTLHEKTMTNAEGAVVYPIKLAWPGQVGQNLGAFFTNVWRCETVSEGFGPSAKIKFIVRTLSGGQYELKNTLGLPVTFDFKWETIQKALSV